MIVDKSWQVRAWAPGRTEIAGNHTDHQGGRVVSAAVTQGVTMMLRENGTRAARVESDGYEPFEIDIRSAEPVAGERNATPSLVRGVTAGLRAAGVPVVGFDARVSSTLPMGGGMSSSAAFELALARGLTVLFAPEHAPASAQGNPWLEPSAGLSTADFAHIAVDAERRYFGKPCGFQDQTASAFGGICDMDFRDLENPAVAHIDFDFESRGYRIALIDTHADHSAHTGDFNRLVEDMRSVARFFGEDVLGRIAPERFFRHLAEARGALGDAAVLRAWHYFTEVGLVDCRAAALRAGDMQAFLRATRASAESSAEYLQNVAVPGDCNQPAMVALAACRHVLAGRGAARIHGGGFGGTIQAYVPQAVAGEFSEGIRALLGTGVCSFVEVSQRGAFAERLGG